jgi:hypothetical protein
MCLVDCAWDFLIMPNSAQLAIITLP